MYWCVCIFCVHYCLFKYLFLHIFLIDHCLKCHKNCIIFLKASGQNGALFGSLGRRAGAPIWVNLVWLQNGALKRRLGTAEMDAERDQNNGFLVAIRRPYSAAKGADPRRRMRVNRHWPHFCGLVRRPREQNKGAYLARFWFFNQNDHTSCDTIYMCLWS